MAITTTVSEHRPESGTPTSTTSGDRWAILSAAAFASFVVLTLVVARGIPILFDQPLLDLARSVDGFPLVWQIVSEAGNIPLIVVGIGIVVWLAATHRVREAILVALVLAAATAGSEAVKEIIARPRPIDTKVLAGVVYSYPSGHILEALTIYGIISLKVWHSTLPPWVRTTFVLAVVIFVFLVGIARAALGAHYPSDIAGGVMAGVGVVAAYAWLTDSGRGVRWSRGESARPQRSEPAGRWLPWRAR